MRDVFAVSSFIEVKEFSQVVENISAYRSQFSGAIGIMNTSVPDFNDILLKLASMLGIHYCDMASDMYNKKTLATLRFGQESYDAVFKKKNIFGLINAGISPGVTNFLIGEKMLDCDDKCRIKIGSVNLYLLENIRSSEIVFSWSPQVAFDELEQKPRFFENKKLHTVEPFSHSMEYEFPHFKEPVEQYPLYQEEILSLHQTFPQIASIKVYTGGSEVELVKSLYQLNLLSKNDPVCKEAGISVEAIVRNAVPKMKTPDEMEQLVRKGVIKTAQFAAMAEITKDDVVEVTGLSFHRYKDLLNSPYRGATYISYPTGIGAAVMFYYTHKAWKQNRKNVNGIIRGEQLPMKIGPHLSETMKLELTKFGIDFVSHVHSLKFVE
ncbi:saccharopine dehydrogenase [Candidatus Peregrinibacteria bacterium]|nr:saccharopine dehydrogenase [Candidatus Peregrinibacteria bacterium]